MSLSRVSLKSTHFIHLLYSVLELIISEANTPAWMWYDLQVLIATDLVARGMDFKGINTVRTPIIWSAFYLSVCFCSIMVKISGHSPACGDIMRAAPVSQTLFFIITSVPARLSTSIYLHLPSPTSTGLGVRAVLDGGYLHLLGACVMLLCVAEVSIRARRSSLCWCWDMHSQHACARTKQRSGVPNPFQVWTRHHLLHRGWHGHAA